jgi:hypothetical protein
MTQKPDNEQREKNIVETLAEWMQHFKRLLASEKHARLIIPLTLLCILAGVAIAQQTIQLQFANYGTIRVIGVSAFWDKACTNQVTSIAWGEIIAGTSIQKHIYIRNDGTATETFSMSSGNWTPPTASSYLTLTWNCSDYALSPKAVTCANLTLVVQPNITGVTNFDFTILIQATG